MRCADTLSPWADSARETSAAMASGATAATAGPMPVIPAPRAPARMALAAGAESWPSAAATTSPFSVMASQYLPSRASSFALEETGASRPEGLPAHR
jgi:hypothetical protein